MVKMGKGALWLPVALSLSLAACGGGGGGGGSSGGGGNPAPQPAPAGTETVISGVVTVGASSAPAASAASSAPASVMEAQVQLLSYDQSGKKLDEEKVLSNRAGGYNSKLVLSNTGGYVVINIQKPGFTDFSRRVDFKNPQDVNLNAEILAVQTTVAQVGTVIAASGETQQTFSFGVFRYPDGTRKAVAGASMAIAKAAGATQELGINIPAANLPGTTTLVGQLQSFDSSNPQEAKSFPGNYEDSDGKRLVSLAFDYIKITDDKGTKLTDLATQAVAAGRLSKAAAENDNITVTRYIPQGSAENLLRDACTGAADDESSCSTLNDVEKAAFNVPLYSSNPRNGRWELIGMGSVDLDGDNVISVNESLPADSNADGTTTAEEIQGHVAANYDNLVIRVSNQDFLESYWNLDYAVVGRPTEVCLTGTLKDSSGNALSGQYLYLSDDDDKQSIAYSYATSDENGKFTFNAVLTSSTDTDRSATLSYYDPYTYQAITQSVTVGDSPNCASTEVVVTKPEMAKVSGRVVDESGNPKANYYVWAYDTTKYYYTSVYTDSDGKFTLEVPQGDAVDLYAGYYSSAALGNIKADNLLGGTETADNTTEVTSADLVVANQAPYAFGYLASTSITAGQSVNAYVYGYDYDGDYPLSYSILSGSTVLASGSIDTQDSYYQEAVLSGLAPGNYPLTLRVTDKMGKSVDTDMGSLTVNEPFANRAPVISYAYPSSFFVAKGGSLTLTGYAYDLDGNPLSWAWYADGQAIDGCSGTGGSANCTYTAPDTDAQVNLTFQVTDGSATTEQGFSIAVGSTSSLDIRIQRH